jgi:3-dehydroquinate synthase
VTPDPDTGAEPTRIAVDLGARSYDILIGPNLIAAAGRRIADLAPGAACAVVTDRNVARAHLGSLEASLDAAGLRHTAVTVEPGEGSKSFTRYAEVSGAVLDARLERGDLIVALGGGVVGDLAGFVAATCKRGMRFVQIPTSLLAQVDSSVGGKTGINAVQGKNLVGAFHQPLLVLADTDSLDTLPRREFRAGYAEVVKYGLIDDPALFDWLDINREAVFAGGPQRRRAIARSCGSKAATVARDEHEQGDRALLNLGHTFGHALERLTLYDGARLVHGEAVAIGVVLAFRFSVAGGLCAAADADRVARHLAAAGLPTRIRDVPGWGAGDGPRADAVLDAMFQDKKVTRGRLNLILARGIGRSFVASDVPADAVRNFLGDEITGI